MNVDALIAGLPGEALVREGLSDLEEGRLTIPASLVNIARSRLSRAGLIPAGSPPSPPEPELELYRLLGRQPGDAYSRYNALLRELASFNNALDHRISREARCAAPNPGPIHDSRADHSSTAVKAVEDYRSPRP